MDATSHHLEKISDQLNAFAAARANGRVSLGDLATEFGDRAFAVLILILSLPNAVGLGAIPGLSTVFGVPQIFIGLQMMFGRERLWLPAVAARRSISGADFKRAVDKATPALRRIEGGLRPRLLVVSSPAFERVLGFGFVVLAAIVSLPIPFGNQPPAVASAVAALGLIERDGVCILGGFVLGLMATAIALAVVFGGAAVLYLVMHRIFG
jgi:hypothetical protein